MPDALVTVPALPVVVPWAVAAALLVARRRPGRERTVALVWVAYAAVVVALTVFPLQIAFGAYSNRAGWSSTLNLVPFVGADLRSTVLNVALFVPFGALMGCSRGVGRDRDRTVRSVAVAALAASLTIELVQFVLALGLGSGRSTDVNDLVANTLGAVAGFALVRSAQDAAFSRARPARTPG